MIEQICAYIHNFFISQNGVPYNRQTDTFTIEDGKLDLPFLVAGCYFLVTGSRFNDGVFVYPADDLKDETFTGTIWEMRPPLAFLEVAQQIAQWNEKYGATVNGPYQSESFGGYSYTLKSGNNASGGTDNDAAGWQGVFKAQLNQWRKLA